jgi:hypothetical protein
MAQNNGVFTVKECRAVIKYLFLKGNSAKKKITTAGTMTIFRERVGYIIHEILDMRRLSAKWVPKCLNADHSVIECLLHRPLWTDFGEILWDFLTVS